MANRRDASSCMSGRRGGRYDTGEDAAATETKRCLICEDCGQDSVCSGLFGRRLHGADCGHHRDDDR